MVPIVTALECSVFLGTRFARTELFAGVAALLGVVLIAHPTSIFGNAENDVNSKTVGEVDEVTPTQRLLAIGAASLGIFCASTAYTLIRVIGNRAHALVSVSYFSLLSTVCSTIALLAIPGIGFTLPEGPREWILLLLLGLFGFALQFLLTAGLQLDRSSKATSMMYSQIVFALLCDWAIWGVLPGFWSFIGGAIVIASTLWSALQKFQGNATESSKTPIIDEETSLLGTETEGAEDAALRRASISA
jgi:drug/metabolite transporter (DMT)-like permease